MGGREERVQEGAVGSVGADYWRALEWRLHWAECERRRAAEEARVKERQRGRRRRSEEAQAVATELEIVHEHTVRIGKRARVGGEGEGAVHAYWQRATRRRRSAGGTAERLGVAPEKETRLLLSSTWRHWCCDSVSGPEASIVVFLVVQGWPLTRHWCNKM